MSSPAKQSREEMVKQLFKTLCRGNAGIMLPEWLAFGSLIGVEGKAEAEYDDIIEHFKGEKVAGLNFKAFSSVINDKEEEWYRSDQEIQQLLVSFPDAYATWAKKSPDAERVASQKVAAVQKAAAESAAIDRAATKNAAVEKAAVIAKADADKTAAAANTEIARLAVASRIAMETAAAEQAAAQKAAAERANAEKAAAAEKLAKKESAEKAVAEIASKIANIEQRISAAQEAAKVLPPGEDALKNFEASSNLHVDAIKLHIQAQLEAMRVAEAAIAVAAQQLDADRRAFERERQSIIKELDAQRAALSKDIVGGLGSLTFSFSDLSSTHVQKYRRFDAQVISGSDAPMTLPTCAKCGGMLLQGGRECAACGQPAPRLPMAARFSLPDEIFSRKSQFATPGDALEPITENEPLDLEVDNTPIDLVEKGPAHAVVIGGMNDFCLDSTLILSAEKVSVSTVFARSKRCKLGVTRKLHGCAMMSTHGILVAGGTDGTKVLQTTEILDLGAMSFRSGPKMSASRQGCAVVTMDQYQVLVAGGSDGINSLNTTEVLNLASNNFAPGPKMVSARWGCAAVNLDGERVMIIGGRVGNWSLNTTEIFDIDTFTVTPGPKLVCRRNGCTAVMITKDRLLVLGGNDGREHFNTTEELDLSSMTFQLGPRMRTKRSSCAALMLDNDRLLVAGGSDGVNCLDTCEIFHITGADGFESAFVSGPRLDIPRSSLAAVLAPHIPPGSDAAAASSASFARTGLVKQIFQLCAKSDPSLLLQQDLERVGNALGIQTSEWAADFPDMCGLPEERKAGVDLEAFSKLLNDRGSTFYCTGHQLSRLLGELEHLKDEDGHATLLKAVGQR